MYQYHTAESTYISVSDDGLGFKAKELTQPAQITDTGADECTLQNIGEKITRTATIKNSYEPDLDNFQGKLIINKTWINHDGSNENTLNNDDFDDAKDYSFTVSRHTKNISERDMFKIETYNETDHMPKVTSLDTSNYFSFTVESPMTKYDSTDAPIGSGDTTTPVEYYKEVLKISQDSYSANMDEVKISVKIYKTADKYNRVEIQGLAIYAQDAIRYTYKLNEDFTNLKAYKNVNDLQNPLSGKMEDYTENNKTVTKREFDLRNELKVFELKLNKVFGKEYIPEGQTEKTIQKLDQADYHQYFNDDFVLNNPKIEFQLQRKEDGEDDSEYKVYKYRGDDWHKVELSGTDPRKVYSKSFKNLPKYSPDGNAYVYRVIERKAPDDAHYKILYSSNDLHVYFWDANNNDVGQPFPGYSLENYNYYDGKFPPEFQLDIPEGAVNFQFNNGVKPNDTLNQYQTKDGYQILNENKENGGNFYEFTSSSPVASNYDRQRFELQQWNYTGTITDPDHESDYDP